MTHSLDLGWTLDFTGPQMVLTLKLSSIAFCYHDGLLPESVQSPKFILPFVFSLTESSNYPKSRSANGYLSYLRFWNIMVTYIFTLPSLPDRHWSSANIVRISAVNNSRIRFSFTIFMSPPMGVVTDELSTPWAGYRTR
jgi:hypothetical protein